MYLCYSGILDSIGAKIEVTKYTERLVPSTRFVAVDGIVPVVSETATFVAPSANVIGDVTLGSNSRYAKHRNVVVNVTVAVAVAFVGMG